MTLKNEFNKINQTFNAYSDRFDHLYAKVVIAVWVLLSITIWPEIIDRITQYTQAELKKVILPKMWRIICWKNDKSFEITIKDLEADARGRSVLSNWDINCADEKSFAKIRELSLPYIQKCFEILDIQEWSKDPDDLKKRIAFNQQLPYNKNDISKWPYSGDTLIVFLPYSLILVRWANCFDKSYFTAYWAHKIWFKNVWITALSMNPDTLRARKEKNYAYKPYGHAMLNTSATSNCTSSLQELTSDRPRWQVDESYLWWIMYSKNYLLASK